MTSIATRLRLKTIQRVDRWRLRRRGAAHPGLELDPSASTNLVSSRFEVAESGRLVIGPRVYTERLSRGVLISVAEGASVEIGADTWLRTDLAPVRIYAYPGAHVRIGREGFQNGCHVSAKARVDIGDRAWIGTGTRIYDADQHDLDADRRERIEPVTIGEHCWIASDVTVLRGVVIGEQSVIGARSIVTRSMPPHTLAIGSPAEPTGKVGDRTNLEI